MKRTRSAALLIIWCVLPTVIRAHHSGSEYDRTTVEIDGQLLDRAETLMGMAAG
jgi:hypothetical protein